MIYHTKVDPGKPAVLLLSAAMPAVMGVIILVAGSATEPMGWIMLMLTPALLWLLLSFTWPVTYDPGATRADGKPILLVRVGRFLRYDIPIADIREVQPKSSVLSSASWSYDRLEVKYRTPGVGGFLLISPRDRDAFLDELAGRAGHLERTGDRLTRRPETPAVS
jgi:Bacterial PH domain